MWWIVRCVLCALAWGGETYSGQRDCLLYMLGQTSLHVYSKREDPRYFPFSSGPVHVPADRNHHKSQLESIRKYYDHGTATPPLSEQNSMTSRYTCHLATKIAAVAVGTIATTYVFLFAYSNLSKYGFSGTWNLIWIGGECDQ